MDNKGIVSVILASSLGIAIIATVIGSTVTGRPITPSGLELLSTVTGAMIGVIASYVANHNA